jgi:hypothetical protein
VDIATSTRAGSSGCGSTVCIAWPPKPAPHRSRCGWSHSSRISSYVTPPSTERKSAEGWVPAYTTSGSAAGAGANCHTRSSVAPVSSGKATGA